MIITEKNGFTEIAPSPPHEYVTDGTVWGRVIIPGKGIPREKFEKLYRDATKAEYDAANPQEATK